MLFPLLSAFSSSKCFITRTIAWDVPVYFGLYSFTHKLVLWAKSTTRC